MANYLDKTGLAKVWSKIKSLLSGYAGLDADNEFNGMNTFYDAIDFYEALNLHGDATGIAWEGKESDCMAYTTDGDIHEFIKAGEQYPVVNADKIDSLVPSMAVAVNIAKTPEKTIYVVKDTSGVAVVGVLVLFCDPQRHVFTEFLISHISNPNTSMTVHADSLIYQHYRSMALTQTFTDPTNGNTVAEGSWSQWNYASIAGVDVMNSGSAVGAVTCENGRLQVIYTSNDDTTTTTKVTNANVKNWWSKIVTDKSSNGFNCLRAVIIDIDRNSKIATVRFTVADGNGDESNCIVKYGTSIMAVGLGNSDGVSSVVLTVPYDSTGMPCSSSKFNVTD